MDKQGSGIADKPPFSHPPNFFHLGVKWLMSRELWHRQGSNRKRNIKSCNLKNLIADDIDDQS